MGPPGFLAISLASPIFRLILLYLEDFQLSVGVPQLGPWSYSFLSVHSLLSQVDVIHPSVSMTIFMQITPKLYSAQNSPLRLYPCVHHLLNILKAPQTHTQNKTQELYPRQWGLFITLPALISPFLQQQYLLSFRPSPLTLWPYLVSLRLTPPLTTTLGVGSD